MAGDWIKVEYTTPEKPEISAIMRNCNCSRGEAFLSWFRLWRHFDQHCIDGVVRNLSASDADEFANLSGISSTLEAEGWLQFIGNDCHIVNWDRHNGRSAKRRSLDSFYKKAKKLAKSA